MVDAKRAHMKTQTTVDNKRIINFVGDVKSEFKKVTWTPKDQLVTYTKIVIGATFVLGVLIFGIDLFIRGSLLGIDKFVRIFTGG